MAEKPEATEAAERKAAELGVDLDTVEGSGSGGNITVEDVTRAASGISSEASGPVTFALADFRLDEFDPSVEGAPSVTRAGTTYETREQADKVREAAKAAGVDLVEVNETKEVR